MEHKFAADKFIKPDINLAKAMRTAFRFYRSSFFRIMPIAIAYGLLIFIAFPERIQEALAMLRIKIIFPPVLLSLYETYPEFYQLISKLTAMIAFFFMINFLFKLLPQADEPNSETDEPKASNSGQTFWLLAFLPFLMFSTLSVFFDTFFHSSFVNGNFIVKTFLTMSILILPFYYFRWQCIIIVSFISSLHFNDLSVKENLDIGYVLTLGYKTALFLYFIGMAMLLAIFDIIPIIGMALIIPFLVYVTISLYLQLIEAFKFKAGQIETIDPRKINAPSKPRIEFAMIMGVILILNIILWYLYFNPIV
ncbi:hypothetical protein KAU32_01725 [bacterium]|nr:hypothetical protein [bacterium]